MCVGGPSRWHVVVGGVTTDPALKSQEGGGGADRRAERRPWTDTDGPAAIFALRHRIARFFSLLFQGGWGRCSCTMHVRVCVCACLVWRPQFGDLLCVAAVVREEKH